jgi:hypothetical protein
MNKKPKEDAIATQKTANNDEIAVITSDPYAAGTRGSGVQSLKVDELAVNVNVFVQQMGRILESTPEKVGQFHFEEFEINAEISADGTIAVLGSGVHAGAKGGLRFVFRREVGSDQ